MDWDLWSLVPEELHIRDVILGAGGVTIVASTATESAPCPECGSASRSVHRHSERVLEDLPWMGHAVWLRVRVRHLGCGEHQCPRRIFSERLTGTAAVHARRTNRQSRALQGIAYELGGQAGAREARNVGIRVSADTLLRLIHTAPLPIADHVVALGVDDWAWRRRHSYGTVLVDLERHRPVDLLPDRSAESFRDWLKTHRGVELISRDRGGEYAEGGRLGAPDAVQVADRFHLLKNIGEVVEKVLRRHSKLVQGVVLPGCDRALPPPRADREAARECSRQRIQERYEVVHAMAAKGMSQLAIGRALGIHRHTVQNYLSSDTVPLRPRYTHKTSILAPYEPYLRKRWRQGYRNGLGLWREIAALGYPGARGNVSRFVAHLRHEERTSEVQPRPDVGLTPRRATGLLLVRPQDVSPEQQVAIKQLKALHPDVQAATTLLEGFAHMLRDRTDEQSREELERWMGRAKSCGLPEMGAFATKVRQDVEAVTAGLTSTYSQGQTEGNVNRLKLLKRQMYGRAGFELLRKRFLNTGAATGRTCNNPRLVFGRPPPLLAAG